MNFTSSSSKRLIYENFEIQYLNAMWTAPLLVVIVGYLLWCEIAWSGMIGLLVVFIIVPIQSELIEKKFSKLSIREEIPNFLT